MNNEIHVSASYISSYSGDLKREITGTFMLSTIPKASTLYNFICCILGLNIYARFDKYLIFVFNNFRIVVPRNDQYIAMEREHEGAERVDRRDCGLCTAEVGIYFGDVGGAGWGEQVGRRLRRDGEVFGLFGESEKWVGGGTEQEDEK